MEVNAVCLLGPTIPDNEPLRHMIASYRGRLYHSSNISKQNDVWIKKCSVRAIFGSFFVNRKMELDGATLNGHQIDADEILYDWDPIWSHDFDKEPLKLKFKKMKKFMNENQQ